MTSRQDMDHYLDVQLSRLRTDHIDFYLLHGLAREVWTKLSLLGVTHFLDQTVADGRIRHAGLSFHDEAAAFREIVDGYDWTFTQIQHNFMDEHYQAGTAGLRYAAGRGIGVVVMEPLRGGALAREVAGVREVWERAPSRRSLADWALRWVWDHPEVTVVLSGMSTLEQVVDNLRSAEAGLPNSLSPEELSLFAEAKAAYAKRIKVACTDCRYCLPCPNRVSIPTCFAVCNLAHVYEAPDLARMSYTFALGGIRGTPAFASQCQECGECEERCPQGIAIRAELKSVVACFGR